ncbi:thermonuclease family protein [Aliiruegeria lutimaris]|uniref:Endonuclease YncB, thermonuclease family n=1 Tax=Aliiruegeria lutimaris TaxID=571298 RepID=A0A1G8ZRM8_9RHOB|nr:thermonuclease family protein [Aliiruegeria lutimaris]SDK17254.1 Endonuclease YncB, thermonuclease family [Aliiruegeria lutimaris]
MEVLFGGLFILGVFYLAFRPSRFKNKTSTPAVETPSELRPNPKPSTETKTDQPTRFDEKSAEQSHAARILSGPAWIVDGDTIKVQNTQIRLFGIDAPELNHPYGKNAKWALHRLCKGHTVRAEISEMDDYGRTVARCYLSDGRDLSAEMVKQGLAIDWPKFSGGLYRNLEPSDVRKKLFLADARQKGKMHVWKKFEERQSI